MNNPNIKYPGIDIIPAINIRLIASTTVSVSLPFKNKQKAKTNKLTDKVLLIKIQIIPAIILKTIAYPNIFRFNFGIFSEFAINYLVVNYLFTNLYCQEAIYG
jgi:hypothetical protein